jgi:hypothetical protein
MKVWREDIVVAPLPIEITQQNQLSRTNIDVSDHLPEPLRIRLGSGAIDRDDDNFCPHNAGNSVAVAGHCCGSAEVSAPEQRCASM